MNYYWAMEIIFRKIPVLYNTLKRAENGIRTTLSSKLGNGILLKIINVLDKISRSRSVFFTLVFKGIPIFHSILYLFVSGPGNFQ